MMKWFLICCIALLAVLFGLREYGYQKTFEASAIKKVVLDEEKLFELTQELRDQNGLNRWVKSEAVCKIAAWRAEEIVYSNNHSGFEQQSKQWVDKFRFAKLSENLVDGYKSEESSLKGWLSSEKHKEAIFEPTYTLSCLRCTGNRCVQIFAK